MKKTIIAVTFVAMFLAILVIAMKRAHKEHNGKAMTQLSFSLDHANMTSVAHREDSKQTSNAEIGPNKWEGHRIPNREERLGMSRKERLALLESLGHLPDDRDWSDFEIGEETSWWGRRLDPKLFWKDKVIWLDGTAVGEAWSYGRAYPPMPYEDPSVQDRSDEDLPCSGFELESPNYNLALSAREIAFWDKFGKTHPLPPRKIIDWQTERANRLLDDINVLTNRPEHAARLGLTEASSERTLESDRYHASFMGSTGYPAECISAEAYRWAHIMQKRKEYEEIQAKGKNVDSLGLTNLFRRVYVDRKYITEPLSAEDLHAANAWKREYLRRLRRENTDESYINAYMKEWGLSSNEVFDVSHN
ncbi:MAG: hypothetical protein GX804_10480 [Lentisphaerae bacterium]|jgi:hypothetical protein|nr:hypothetical protein [Lentisphaerota bacterium]